jgi:uncharacterized SAM-binding protein YcdF (DUF218 family)
MPRALGARSIGGDIAIIATIVGIGVVAFAAYALVRIWDEGSRSDDQPAGAIVVMGAAQYDGLPSPVLRARLDHAIGLWEAGRAPIMVMTGGKQEGDRTTEAAAATAYAVSHGVPADAILAETEGRTTEESLDRVRTLLAQHAIADAVFVSDPTHMLRVLRMASDRGIAATGSPTRTSPIESDALRRVEATVHEIGALAWYFLSGGRAEPASAGG